jgi:hypothetical protein
MRRDTTYKLIALWAAAILLNLFLLLLYYFPETKKLIGDEVSYVLRAGSIVDGLEVKRALLWPPGYDYFLAATLHIASFLGWSHQFLVAQIVQICLWCCSGIIFWEISSKLIKPVNARLLALSLFLLNPTCIAFSHYLWPETVHLTVYLAAIWILFNKRNSILWNSILGVLLALSSLLKLVYLPITLLIIIGIPIHQALKRRLAVSGIVPLVFFLLLVSPTLHENYREHHKIVIADSTVFNIWVGLNDKELTDWYGRPGVGHELKVFLNSAANHTDRNKLYIAKIGELIQTRGIFRTFSGQVKKQYFRLLDHRTFFIKQLPGGMKPKYSFSNATLVKGLIFYHDAVWLVTLVGAGAGCFFLLRSPVTWTHFFMMLLLYNAAIFLILHVKTRYVIQFSPMLSMVASVGIYYSLNRFLPVKADENQEVKITGIRCMLGITFSILLVIFGFYSPEIY